MELLTPRLEKGYYVLPKGPGFGVDFTPAVLKTFAPDWYRLTFGRWGTDMELPEQLQTPRRRDILRTMGAACVGLSSFPRRAFGAPGKGPNNKRLWGIFPIAQTPFTESNKLDVDSLIEELKFIDRGGVHGFVWPQLASEWDTLSEAERLEGAEALAAQARRCVLRSSSEFRDQTLRPR